MRRQGWLNAVPIFLQVFSTIFLYNVFTCIYGVWTQLMKEKKDIALQIRITRSEKFMIDQLRELDPNVNISRLFREKLSEECEKMGIKRKDVGIGKFKIAQLIVKRENI